MITLDNITKDYHLGKTTVKAVRGVSLTIKKGEFATLAGPSGSGKTTLLNIIGGLDQSSSGEVSVAGNVINDFTPGQLSDMRLNKIGFIFQAYNLIPVLSAIENVEYVLLLQGMSSEERNKRSSAILKEVGLENEMHRRPHKLSGGQQQRVAIARAVVGKPKLLLADEPTGNLDSQMGDEVMEILKTLNKLEKTTVVMVTHDSRLSEQTERVIRLFDGRQVN